jgi:hypothetical protein
MCTFEVHLSMISGQLILSGKPFNTFSMARLNILQLCLTITPLFTTTGSYYINPCYHAWHAFFFLFNHFPPMICDKGIFFYSRDPPLFFFFFFFFFLFFFFFFKVFVYGKGVQNACKSKFTKKKFFNFHLYFRRHLPLMPPS